jgi:hypothetical protein
MVIHIKNHSVFYKTSRYLAAVLNIHSFYEYKIYTLFFFHYIRLRQYILTVMITVVTINQETELNYCSIDLKFVLAPVSSMWTSNNGM